MNSIYSNYTHRLRMANQALRGSGPKKERLNQIECALENLVDEYAGVMQLLDESGFEVSHNVNGEISSIYKSPKKKD